MKLSSDQESIQAPVRGFKVPKQRSIVPIQWSQKCSLSILKFQTPSKVSLYPIQERKFAPSSICKECQISHRSNKGNNYWRAVSSDQIDSIGIPVGVSQIQGR